MSKHPEFDSGGYPTDNTLWEIENWNPRDPWGLMDYVIEAWRWSDIMIEQEGREITLITGGWSGNESIVSSLRLNIIFWSMNLLQSRRGCKYWLEIKNVRDT